MRRSDREQDLEFSLDLIDRCTYGVVAISTGEDTPYCLPLSFVRLGNSLYFHCAKEGRKLDLLRRNPRVCVTFVGGDIPAFIAPSTYTTYFQSVIACGTACEVTDNQEKIDALQALCQKLTPNDMGAGFDLAIQKTIGITAVWRIHMVSITGKAKLKK